MTKGVKIIKKICAKDILKYLNNMCVSEFTGAVKLSFESGILVNINESNAFNVCTEPFDSKKITELINYVIKSSFTGSIVFLYAKGKLTERGYIRTYSSSSLLSLMAQSVKTNVSM